LHARALLCGIVFGLSWVALLFAAADDDPGRVRALLLASGTLLATGLMLVMTLRRGRKR
jgi:drug/metabolite transporter (DMT)-like permease